MMMIKMMMTRKSSTVKVQLSISRVSSSGFKIIESMACLMINLMIKMIYHLYHHQVDDNQDANDNHIMII
jgi:hypothetical protein